jgi:glutaconate CoA-transferase, subunit A
VSKVISLTAATELIKAGQTLALGGMANYRRPVGFVRALIQRPSPPHDLTLLAFTAGLESDLLVGAGLVSRSRSCYFGLETFGLAPMFTQAVNDGRLTIIEESEASIACGLRATMAGVGFMPSRAWLGTDMFRARPDVQIMTDPYTGERVTAFPALSCHVAVIHVLRADHAGNAVLGGNPTIDLELATVAPTVILTCEELLPALNEPIDIPGQPVTAVVHLPHGAWPTSCYPLYPLDGLAILDYIAACNEGQFAAFLERPPNARPYQGPTQEYTESRGEETPPEER